MQISDIPAMLSPREQLLYLTGLVAREVATVNMNLRSFVQREMRPDAWDALTAAKFDELVEAATTIIRKQGGREDINESMLDALGFATQAMWDATPYLQFLWLPEYSDETNWSRFSMMFTDETDLTPGSTDAATMCEVITNLRHAHYRLFAFPFLTPSSDGTYFMLSDDMLERVRGEYDTTPGGHDVLNAPDPDA